MVGVLDVQTTQNTMGIQMGTIERNVAGSIVGVVALAAGVVFSAPTPDEDLVWMDGSQLPLEGKGFKDVGADLYMRLPAAMRAKPDISKIKGSATDSTGLNFRFKTNSDILRIRWSLANDPPYGNNSATGIARSGVDVYSWLSGHGWRFWMNRKPDARTNTLDVAWYPDRACMVYLPLFNRVESFSIGIRKGATISKARPHAVGKPVVVYGTSMVHGYSSSRPGLLWTSMLGRLIDAEIINQGYSGNGKLEESMLEFLGDIDAAAYCFLNCGEQFPIETMRKLFPPFMERLHKRRPSVPIVLGEYYYVNGPKTFDFKNPKRDFIADMVADFKERDREFWKNLYVVRMEDMIVPDGSIDAAHLSDIGAKQMAEAFADVLRRALDLK